MGLDMYLIGKIRINPEIMADMPKMPPMERELGYWRKHPNLHGYIVQTYAGGRDECQKIKLTKKQLEDILLQSEADNLPHTSGFFFGESQPEDKPETKEILTKALKWLTKDEPGLTKTVYYQASW